MLRTARIRLAPLGLAVVVGVIGAGCGDDGGAGGGGRPIIPRVTISASDSSGRLTYLVPKRVPGGLLEIRFSNDSGRRRKAQLWRVDKGRMHAGGPAATNPGESSAVVQHLRSGRYEVRGARNERAAVARFRVVGGSGAVGLPRTGASIEARDFDFETHRLRAGSTSVLFENSGREPHHAVLAPMTRGATRRDVRRFLRRPSGRAPLSYSDAHETAVLGPGQRQVLELELRAGRYALLCFVRSDGGRPHTQRGMVRILEISR